MMILDSGLLFGSPCSVAGMTYLTMICGYKSLYTAVIYALGL